MVRNCGENHVRYARVPTGHETCAFCFMLASRGFVYHSKATAKGLHGYHPNCDCIVVPGVPGETRIDEPFGSSPGVRESNYSGWGEVGGKLLCGSCHPERLAMRIEQGAVTPW